ncbi:MAG TPA: zinc ribbon domain-containing protein [Blastocatellia bacterium]|nr:zinc ribbon domain-containing protein [Blastocatellia bacterium]HMV83307.1 zinc ribbon domain-containing protein [Blastocatellia bacterium]HMX24207.1 zinc ribbon domain-containing protein [Blastocatellia bacterium]HMY73965.1 zinc ribbon domain-containing protein [Blastocatellia bacterium]HMZ16588.1 zinc ribbon domain-containing protein [Blastocatellia bacterium]
MSAEFIPVMSGSDQTSYTFEHDVTRQVAGDIESVRAKLADALEQMGYRVLNETPLQARRSAKSGASSGCSADILEYQTLLNIGLKSAGPNSTRVTFAYTVKGVYSGHLSRGDRNTLTREAEALLALALARTSAAHCPACGADTAGSSRFCRRCGAPLGVATPPEMEVLRLTSNANASYSNLSGGLLFILIALACLIPLFFGGSDPVKFAKLVKILSVVSGSLGAVGIFMLLAGMARLRATLRKPIEQDSLPQTPRRSQPEGINAPDTNELPPAFDPGTVSHSVVEATTDLLPHEIKRAS